MPADVSGFFECYLVILLQDKGILMLPGSLDIFERCNQFGGGWKNYYLVYSEKQNWGSNCRAAKEAMLTSFGKEVGFCE